MNNMPVGDHTVPLRLHAAAILCLLVGVAAIYGRVGGFGYSGIDDHGYVIYTEAVRLGLSWEGVRWAFTAFHMSNWHPLTWLSYMLDISLFGLNPGAQHIVNVVLHAINSVLVYVFGLLVLRKWFASFLIAWLFMAHPLHVESVAWIAERKDLLCGLFFLLALIAHVHFAARPSVARYGWVVLAFVLALLSKPMAVTLPLVLLLLDYWPLHRFNANALIVGGRRVPVFICLFVEKLPLLLLSLSSGILTLMAQTTAMAPIEDVPLSYRLMNAVLSCAVYLRDMVDPTNLAVFYPLFPIDALKQFLPAAVLITGVSGLAIFWWRRFPWLIVGWLWFLVMLLPVIGLIQVGSQSHADRYMYLPSLGLLLAFGAMLARMDAKRLRTAALALVPAALFYAAIAWVQVGYWSGPYMLFSRVIDVVGENYQSHVSLSIHFLNEGMIDEAEEHAIKAINLGSDTAIVYANLGAVLLVREQFADAEKLFRMALERAPNDAQIMNNLGVTLEEQGKIDEARKYFEQALINNPNLFKVRNNLNRLQP
jgi:protein O-mannosyl-transferase